MPQAGGVCAALPPVHGAEVAIQGRAGGGIGQGEGHFVDPVGKGAVYGKAGVREHVEHGRVVGEGLGRKGADALLSGQRDQVLQEQGGDSPVMHVVGDRESDFGSPGRDHQHRVAAHAD